MADLSKDLQFVQNTIINAVDGNDYNDMNGSRFRNSLKRLCASVEKNEEEEARIFGYAYRKMDGSQFCSVDDKEKVNIRLQQIIGQPLSLVSGTWLLECIGNGMFAGMDNTDYE
jgi:hypothetical protein